MAVVYCVCISYIVHEYIPFLPAVLSCRHAACIPIYTRHQPYTAKPCHAAVYRCQSEYTARSPHAPLHMPLRRSYFNSNGLLLLGYKYPTLVVKMRYSLILAVWWLLLDVRLFWCRYRYAVHRVLHGVGWGIYYILRGAGYSLYHTPHIKRGEIRRLACVRPSWRVLS